MRPLSHTDCRILAWLEDGEWHPLNEFLDAPGPKVDPTDSLHQLRMVGMIERLIDRSAFDRNAATRFRITNWGRDQYHWAVPL